MISEDQKNTKDTLTAAYTSGVCFLSLTVVLKQEDVCLKIEEIVISNGCYENRTNGPLIQINRIIIAWPFYASVGYLGKGKECLQGQH